MRKFISAAFLCRIIRIHACHAFHAFLHMFSGWGPPVKIPALDALMTVNDERINGDTLQYPVWIGSVYRWAEELEDDVRKLVRRARFFMESGGISWIMSLFCSCISCSPSCIRSVSAMESRGGSLTGPSQSLLRRHLNCGSRGDSHLSSSVSPSFSTLFRWDRAAP